MTEHERFDLWQYARCMTLPERMDMWERAAILERHLHVMQHGSPMPLSQHAQALGKWIAGQFSGPWFHGGAPDLKPGDRLLPASATGLDPRFNGQMVPDRERFVHITASAKHAADFAFSYPGGGVVYEVEPVGMVQNLPVQARLAELMVLDTGDDLDHLSICLSICTSFCCEAATVVRDCDSAVCR